jgi:DNA uptake protein ComE-like DNA-binding protein
MLDSKNRFSQLTHSQLSESSAVKLWQLPVTALLLSLALLSGCNQKPSSSPTAGPPATSSETKPATAGKIDVNSASIAELDKLELRAPNPASPSGFKAKDPTKVPTSWSPRKRSRQMS